MNVTIDNGGRVVIPKRVRELAGLRPGVELAVEYRDGKIQIEPACRPVRMVRKGNSFVLRAPRGTPPLTVAQVNDIVQRVRNREV